jgi:hypothetical protein
MAGFASALGLAVPIIKDIASAIQAGIDKKTSSKDVSDDASKKAIAAAGNDKKKGTAAATAVTPVVSEAAKAAADEVAKKLSKTYSKAQRELSIQLAIAGSLHPFFEAEDNLFAMTQVITYKEFGKNLNADDKALLQGWWSIASKNLKTIGTKSAEIAKLENPERHDLEYVIQSVNDDDVVTTIEVALKSLDTGKPQASKLYNSVDHLSERLHRATFAALSILTGLSEGLRNAADQTDSQGSKTAAK